MGQLDGKVAIVTGASRGIGAEIARRLAGEGARVVCAARTLNDGEHALPGGLNDTVGQIKAAGGEAIAVAVNLADPADCAKLVESATEAYGPAHILVNNAALTYFFRVKDFPLERWMRSWAVNFHAVVTLCQLVLPAMIERGSGAIVNISSSAAIGPGRGPYKGRDPSTLLIGASCYGAEKAAMERFTQSLASETFEDGISVTSLAPSLVVPTPGTLHHKLVRSLEDPEGEPASMMADAVLLLVTKPVDEVTGRVVYSQQLLKEYGLLPNARGVGVDRPGSGFSQMP